MDRDRILEQYRTEGYAVIPDALSADQVECLNGIVDRDRAQHPDVWGEGPVTGSGASILHRHPELDEYVRHSELFPLFQAILSGPDDEDVRFGQVDFREVSPEGTDESGMDYHRDVSFYGDVGGTVFDPENPYTSTFACVIYYLWDVHECCPCFNIVPRSHEYRTLEAAKEGLGEDYEEIDVRGDAGTAVLYNITNYHTRVPGDPDCPHGRRTLHNYHSRESNPPLTDFITVPEELAMSDDPETRAFYSQWTPDQIEFAHEHYEEVPDRYP